MSNYNPDTYCSLAFTGFDTRTKSVCCWADVKSKFNSYTEAMASPEVVALQQDLVAGIKNPICHTCWKHEEVGITSMRRNNFTKQPVEKKLKKLVIDSGNVCNLACRTCSPHSSSSLIKEYEYKTKKQFNLIKKTDLEYLKNEDYSSLEFVSILGGEPFQNLDHLEILELINKQGYAKNCSLNYVTNGTVSLSSKIKKLFSEFKYVGLVLSVDGTERQFEYIRTNGVWEVLNKNVDDLAAHAHLHGHPTVSALNVLYLDELFQWYADRNIKFDIVFCEQPAYYSFSIFNDAQKTTLINHLSQSKFDMSSVIQQISKSVFSPSMLRQFYIDVEFTKEFKKLDINEYLPKLMVLLR